MKYNWLSHLDLQYNPMGAKGLYDGLREIPKMRHQDKLIFARIHPVIRGFMAKSIEYGGDDFDDDLLMGDDDMRPDEEPLEDNEQVKEKEDGEKDADEEMEDDDISITDDEADDTETGSAKQTDDLGGIREEKPPATPARTSKAEKLNLTQEVDALKQRLEKDPELYAKVKATKNWTKAMGLLRGLSEYEMPKRKFLLDLGLKAVGVNVRHRLAKAMDSNFFSPQRKRVATTKSTARAPVADES